MEFGKNLPPPVSTKNLIQKEKRLPSKKELLNDCKLFISKSYSYLTKVIIEIYFSSTYSNKREIRLATRHGGTWRRS